MPRQLYTLTDTGPDNDLSIFLKASKREYDEQGRMTHGASWFTSFYLREPSEPFGWSFDHKIDPAWQLDFHHEERVDLTVIGGMGSAKTSGVAMSALVYTTTIPNFKFLNVAPVGAQAYAMFDFLQTAIDGTLFEERFVWKMTTKPYPKILIRYIMPNGRHIRSQLEFMSAADSAVRIKNYEADWVNLDQAEMEPNLIDAMSFLGTRVRGSVKGRARMGRMSVLANAEDNPDLWTIFDMQDEYPETNRSWLVTTRSNKNNTEAQIEGFKRRMGYDQARIDQHLEGKRPPPKGDEFPKSLVEPCIDESLDQIMASELEKGTPGFVLEKTRMAKVMHWQMPPEEGCVYWVVSDPGQGVAPGRNAPTVMVFDVTGYPDSPMVLRALWWGDGGGKYLPWKNQFLLWMDEYHALAGAYDATAGQKVHSEFTFPERATIQPVDMSGIKKNSFINTLKMVMARQRLVIPRGIPGLLLQLGKYKLPDTKLAQDMVACLLVLAGLLWAMGLEVPPEPGHGPMDEPPEDDQHVAANRYARPKSQRAGRSGGRRRW